MRDYARMSNKKKPRTRKILSGAFFYYHGKGQLLPRRMYRILSRKRQGFFEAALGWIVDEAVAGLGRRRSFDGAPIILLIDVAKLPADRATFARGGRFDVEIEIARDENAFPAGCIYGSVSVFGPCLR